MQITRDLYLVGSEQFGVSHVLDCNCYLINHGEGLALIDSGIGLGVDEIIENIRSAGFDPQSLTHVFITHAHLGHWGGAPEIRRRTGAKIYVPAESRYWMENIAEDRTIWQNLEFGRWPQDLNPQPCTPDVTFGDGERIPIGRSEIRTIVVQGHTRDSTCLLWESEGRRAIFTGDVIFYGGLLGLINADGSSLADYRRDLPKLADLQIDRLFPGHSVFVLRDGQKHINRALRKLTDFVLPETFFESNEFLWQKDYLESMQ